MKTLISILTIAVSLISCNNTETKTSQKQVYKFINIDTGKEYMTTSGMLKGIEDGKCWRLDLKTNECSQYSTSLAH